MTCEYIKNLLTAYALGDLNEKETAQVKAHLETCGGCRTQAQEAAQTLDLLQSSLTAASPVPTRLSEQRRKKIMASTPAAQSTTSEKKGEKKKNTTIIKWLTSHHPQIVSAAAVIFVFVMLCGLILPRMLQTAGRSTSSDKFLGLDLSHKEVVGYAPSKDVEVAIIEPEAPPELEEIDEILEGLPEPPEPVEPEPPNTEVTVNCPLPSPASDFSPKPAEMDSVATVKSPVTMKGIFGGRSPGTRGSIKTRASAPEKTEEEPLVEIEFGTPSHDSDGDAAGHYRRAEGRHREAQKRRKNKSRLSFAQSGEEATRKKTEERRRDDEVEDLERKVSEMEERLAEEKLKKEDLQEKYVEVRRVIEGFRSPAASDASGAAGQTGIESSWKKEKDRLSEDTTTQPESILVKSETSTIPDLPEMKRLHTGRKHTAEVEDNESAPTYKAIGVNPFVDTRLKAFSTFAIDVDTASYTMARNYMRRGLLPPAEKVRTEEFVNFFDYDYKPPAKNIFKVYTECAPSRFGTGLHLLKIGVKGKRLGREEQQKAILTFAIDTSGSMNRPDRLGLVKKSLAMLLEELAPNDKVAIVRFGSKAKLALAHTPVSEKKKILEVIDTLQTSGSTNLELAMELAYETASKGFKGGASNRVLIMSDGVANLGSGAAEQILDKVEAYRNKGVQCSVFGFGIGTYNDEMLETLANKGDGAYVFIDSEEEARRVFVNDLAATLNTIASDVKIQVQFMPEQVKRYRQLGYENRQLKKEQFRDDTVDAGEVGSGQSVTALYELEMENTARSRQQQMVSQYESPMAIVRIRYKRTDNNKVEEIEAPVYAADIARSFKTMPARFKLAAAVAELSEILRGSPFVSHTYSDVAKVLRETARDLDLDKRVGELSSLVETAGSMSRAPLEDN